MAVLLISMWQLVPDLDIPGFGVQALEISTFTSAFILFLNVCMIRRSTAEGRRNNITNVFLNLPPMLLYAIGGISLLRGDISGMNSIVTAFAWSYVKAMIDAWVLVVEIKR